MGFRITVSSVAKGDAPSSAVAVKPLGRGRCATFGRSTGIRTFLTPRVIARPETEEQGKGPLGKRSAIIHARGSPASMDLNDPRLDPFRGIQEQRLRDTMVVEGEFAVQRLLASGLEIRSIVATPTVAERLREGPAGIPIYILPAADLRMLAGYTFHRGCMACATRPQIAVTLPTHRAVIAMGLSDPLNVGALIRNIKAFGAAGLWLGPHCADPFSRRATRASMGHNLSVPIFRIDEPLETLQALTQAKIASVAATLGESASSLHDFSPPKAWTLWVGNEGHGLPPALREHCSHGVEIPMAPGCDSLNVATATGIFLYQLCATTDRKCAE